MSIQSVEPAIESTHAAEDMSQDNVVEADANLIAENVPDNAANGPRRRDWLTRGVLLRLIPVVIVIVIALVGPLLVRFNPLRVVARPSLHPNGTYWFGTDSSGLDVFSRTIVATRTDLFIGLGVMAISTVLGVIVGILLGMNESRRGIRSVAARGVARLIDLMHAVPLTVAVIVVLALYGRSLHTLIVVVALLISPIQVRVTRTEVLKVRGDAYLDAARLAGQSEIRLTIRHVLPNAVLPALENATVMFGGGILVTAGLGFLGLGLPPPTAEWGTMISGSASQIALGRWWSALFPGAALALTVASVVVLSSALVDRKK
jgi:peptide/nickel transport system permease protein